MTDIPSNEEGMVRTETVGDIEVAYRREGAGPAVVFIHGLAQDGSDYFNFHHTADDVLDRIEPENLDQNVAAWAALLWLIANSDVDFRAAPAAE